MAHHNVGGGMATTASPQPRGWHRDHGLATTAEVAWRPRPHHNVGGGMATTASPQPRHRERAYPAYAYQEDELAEFVLLVAFERGS